MSQASTKPYLIRAIHEWCTDHGLTPYLAVAVDEQTRVPPGYARNGEIVLNVSVAATNQLQLDNDFISFQARFNGRAHDIVVPVSNVSAIYARENGHGMAFDVVKAAPVVGATPRLRSTSSEDRAPAPRPNRAKPNLSLAPAPSAPPASEAGPAAAQATPGPTVAAPATPPAVVPAGLPALPPPVSALSVVTPAQRPAAGPPPSTADETDAGGASQQEPAPRTRHARPASGLKPSRLRPAFPSVATPPAPEPAAAPVTQPAADVDGLSEQPAVLDPKPKTGSPRRRSGRPSLAPLASGDALKDDSQRVSDPAPVDAAPEKSERAETFGPPDGPPDGPHDGPKGAGRGRARLTRVK